MVGIKKHKNLKTNKMRNLFKLCLVIFSLTIVSCEEEEINNDADIRDEFVGNWLVLENSDLLGIRAFEVDIVKDQTDGEQINISNFYKLGDNDTVFANVSPVQSTTFIIPIQTVSGHFINGTGALSGDEIEMVYYVDDGNEKDTISATFTREIN